MSIRFSSVTIQNESGLVESLLIEGHPDKEAILSDSFVRERTARLTGNHYAAVQHYRFITDSSDEDADCDHFAMMEAYDELACECDAEPFIERGDVEHLDYFEVELEREETI